VSPTIAAGPGEVGGEGDGDGENDGDVEAADGLVVASARANPAASITAATATANVLLLIPSF
jgi:hypothetical protein